MGAVVTIPKSLEELQQMLQHSVLAAMLRSDTAVPVAPANADGSDAALLGVEKQPGPLPATVAPAPAQPPEQPNLEQCISHIYTSCKLLSDLPFRDYKVHGDSLS